MFVCNNCNEIIGAVSEDAIWSEGIQAHIKAKGREDPHNDFTTLRFGKKAIEAFIEDLELTEKEINSP